MHYTAMAAVGFYGETSAPNSGYVINHFVLPLGVASLGCHHRQRPDGA